MSWPVRRAGGRAGAPGRRVALRIAARDARRHPWRSLLVMLLVGIPVAVVSAGAILTATFTVDAEERAEMALGSADASLWHVGVPVEQARIPQRWGVWPVESNDEESQAETDGSVRGAVLTDAEVERVRVQLEDLLDGARAVPWGNDDVSVLLRLGDGTVRTEIRQGDLADPLLRERFEVIDGRLPQQPGEVLISRRLEQDGFAIGDQVQTTISARPLTVVGVHGGVNDTQYYADAVLAASGTYPVRANEFAFLVEAADGAVTAAELQQLNRAGFGGLSRAVVADADGFEQYDGSGLSGDDVAFVALFVTMVLLEIALLAGPAFAVTAREQTRTVALMTINGATPRQARRVVTSAAMLLGGLAAGLGVLLAVAVSRAVPGLVEMWWGESPGPFEVPWLWLAPIVLCGLLSAGLAAFVPAWTASRQDPVAVMAGRRSDRISAARSTASTVVGLVFVGVGVLVMSAALADSGGSGGMAFAIMIAVLLLVGGMVLVIPGFISLVVLMIRGSSFAVRFAARDAVRHRARTVPAVAAVAATVAGVVMAGIISSSDYAQYSGDHDGRQDRSWDGRVEVEWYPHVWDESHREWIAGVWDSLVDEAERRGASDVVVLRHLDSRQWTEGGTEGGTWWEVELPGDMVASHSRRSEPLVVGSGDDLADYGVAAEQRAQVQAALDRGRVVQFWSQKRSDDRARNPEAWEDDWIDDEEALAAEAEEQGEEKVPPMVGRSEGKLVLTPVAEWDGLKGEPLTMDAVFVEAEGGEEGGEDSVASATLVPPSAAEQAGLRWGAGSMSVRGLDALDDRRAFAATAQKAMGSGYSEGWIDGEGIGTWDPRSERLLILLALTAGGALLMVIGTVTATTLALTDARPDLATLSAVGAGPSVRRRLAFVTTLVIAGSGAALGAAVGALPGVLAAVHHQGWRGLDVPWLALGVLVFGVPLLTALVIAACTRSRLPMVQRVE